MADPLLRPDLVPNDLRPDIISVPERRALEDSTPPRTPFWDLAPAGAYVQFDERLITPWERVSIAGVTLPGRCMVMSPGRARKINALGGPGDQGEYVVDLGATAADVQIVCQIWTSYHLSAWEDFTSRMRDLFETARSGTGPKTRDGKPTAVDIVHPGLNLAGISSVFVYQVGVLQPGSVRGVMESTLLATEYRDLGKQKKSQAVFPIGASADALIDNMQVAADLQKAAAKTPADTETKP